MSTMTPSSSTAYNLNHVDDSRHLKPLPPSPSPSSSSSRRNSSSFYGSSPNSPPRPPPSSYTFPRSVSHHQGELEHLGQQSSQSDFGPPTNDYAHHTVPHPDYLSPNFPNLPGRGWGRKRANSSSSVARRSISGIAGLLPRRTSVSGHPPQSSPASAQLAQHQQASSLPHDSRIGSSTDSIYDQRGAPPGPSAPLHTFGVPASMNTVIPPVKQRVISDRRSSSSSKMRRASQLHSPTSPSAPHLPDMYPGRASSPVSVFSATTTSSHPPPSSYYAPSHTAALPPAPALASAPAAAPQPVLLQHPTNGNGFKPYLDKLEALVDMYKTEPWFLSFVVVGIGIVIKILGFRGTIVALLMIASGLFARFILPPPNNHVRVADPHPPPGALSDSVSWINHALRALFPLISTDVLTPFVDLLEDALMEQVPPVVTSVRLTSLSLGREPVLLTSMRPITDDEWFKGLAQQPKKKKGEPEDLEPGTYVVHSAYKPPPSEEPANGKRRHARSHSTASKTSLLSRRSTAQPPTPELELSDAAAAESEQLRKRDKLKRRLRLIRAKHDPRVNGEALAQCLEDEDMDDDELDGDAGQYVNYEIGFVYRRTQRTTGRGNAIHALAYFGWGVKGLGGSEIPIYLDVGELKGTVRVRILLSASPPFARTATFSFVKMPEFDISARPLRAGSFNAMDIPLIKSYVMKSVAQVAGGFVAPKSFTMDIDRMLLGREAMTRTISVGVLHVVIHSAYDLPKMDSLGTCDAYVIASYSKFNKPLYSTRTIVNSANPIWEEHAFLLVSEETIDSGEKLRLRLCDSDRFSADDSLGVIEVDVAEIVDRSTRTPGEQLFYRRDELQPEHPGMRVQGMVDWSVRFFPLHKISQQELERRIEENRDKRGEGSTPAPWWLEWLDKWCERPEWEKEREVRRKEMVQYFTGERIREEIEAGGKPGPNHPSGILQFHIHQAVDLELQSVTGTFAGSGGKHRSPASGKPALGDAIDRAPWENPDPPNPYVEVHLNDKFIYRTRTKQVNPMPYFNAMSERFIRDWRLAKIVFVIKDERDREHDPIIGIVSLPLKDVLKDGCQVTRWYPIVGGLGWGMLRVSLLFKPLEMHLPEGASSYDAATFDLLSLSSTDLSNIVGKAPHLLVETEYDRVTLNPPGGAVADDSDDDTPPSTDATASLLSAAGVNSAHAGIDMSYEITKPIRLAVRYRTSCSVLFSFHTRGALRKAKIFAIATMRLINCPDSEKTEKVIPVFLTRSTRHAFYAARIFEDYQKAVEMGNASPEMLKEARLVGFIKLSFVLHPGVSRAHRKLAKRDPKFHSVYKAWEATRLLESAAARNDSDSDLDYESAPSDDEYAAGQRAAAKMAEDDSEAMLSGNAHGKALREHNRGIFQLKLARTGKFMKDKIGDKVRNNKIAGHVGIASRPHGHDVEVEHEGQSSL